MTFLIDRSGLFAFRNEYLENDQDSRHGETLFSFGPLHKKHEQNLSFFKKKVFFETHSIQTLQTPTDLFA